MTDNRIIAAFVGRRHMRGSEWMNMPMAAVFGIVAMLTGCEYSDSFSNPVSRNFSWFEYVGGRGLKEACGPGTSDRMRFVYNGNYDEQIRTYDVRELPDGRGAMVSAWVRGDGNLIVGIDLPELRLPWDGDRVEETIDLRAFAKLQDTLKADRFDSDRPMVLQLPSNEYYWVVTGCLDGQFYSNAWLYPSKRFKLLMFPDILLAHDRTGIAFRDAATAKVYEDYPNQRLGDRGSSDYSFLIQLGDEGVLGSMSLF